jgi:hypothetical protein
MPVRRNCVQMSPAIRGHRFIDLSQGNRPDQHPITLNEHEI